MSKSPKVKIVWEPTRGSRHSKTVNEVDAPKEMSRLRSLPDVKSNSVRLSL